MIRIKLLIRPHEGDKVIGIRQIDDIMRPAGDHVDSFDLLTADLKANLLVRVDVALLNQCATADDDEELPLRVVPVLSLSDAGLADIYAELTVIGCFQQLGKRTAIVAVHL